MEENNTPLDQMDTLLENHPVLEKTVSARNKQSVRTTFKLSQTALDAKAWLAKHWGITQKEASDEICNTLPKLLEGLKLPEGFSIKESAKLLRMTGNLVRKTQVISRGSRRILEDMAKKHGVSRDEMFDFSLFYFKFIVENQEKKTRENRIKALELLGELADHARRVESELNELLDDDDPIREKFSDITFSLGDLAGSTPDDFS